MENKKVSEKKDSWLKALLSYTEGSGQRLGISVILSVISIISGLDLCHIIAFTVESICI